MKLRKLFVFAILVLVLGIVGCDDNSSNAQDGPDDPGSMDMGGMTSFTGKVVPQGNTSCAGGIEGIMIGDEIAATLTRTSGSAGTAMVQVNAGDDGMFSCSASGTGTTIIDSPPITFISCTVDTVSSQITGLKVGDIVGISYILTGGESAPIQKEAAISSFTTAECTLVDLETLNAQQ